MSLDSLNFFRRLLRSDIENSRHTFQVFDHDLPGIHFQQSFGLQPREIARDQLANRSELVGQFLVAARQSEFHSSCSPLAFTLCQSHQRRDKPLTNCGER